MGGGVTPPRPSGKWLWLLDRRLNLQSGEGESTSAGSVYVLLELRLWGLSRGRCADLQMLRPASVFSAVCQHNLLLWNVMKALESSFWRVDVADALHQRGDRWRSHTSGGKFKFKHSSTWQMIVNQAAASTWTQVLLNVLFCVKCSDSILCSCMFSFKIKALKPRAFHLSF